MLYYTGGWYWTTFVYSCVIIIIIIMIAWKTTNYFIRNGFKTKFAVVVETYVRMILVFLFYTR